MKPWLRLTLIGMTVGGGFTGVVVIFEQLLVTRGQPPAYYVILMAFLALYAFVMVSGLIFVQNPGRTLPLVVSLVLQIPWVSSPIVAYEFVAGLQVGVALVGGGITGGFRLGSSFEFHLFQQFPWGVGLNLFAVVLLLFLLRAEWVPSQEQQPTTAPPGLSAAADDTESSDSATPPYGGCD